MRNIRNCCSYVPQLTRRQHAAVKCTVCLVLGATPSLSTLTPWRRGKDKAGFSAVPLKCLFFFKPLEAKGFCGGVLLGGDDNHAAACLLKHHKRLGDVTAQRSHLAVTTVIAVRLRTKPSPDYGRILSNRTHEKVAGILCRAMKKRVNRSSLLDSDWQLQRSST